MISRSNHIDWVKRASLFLKINGFTSYIDNTEQVPDKSLYYKSNLDSHVTNKPYSLKLTIRYIDTKAKLECNEIKALSAIKLIIPLDNVNRFKHKITANSL